MVVYNMDVNRGGNLIQNMTGNSWFFVDSDIHPSNVEIQEKIKQINSTLAIIAIVITNLIEFKSEIDYLAFAGKYDAQKDFQNTVNSKLNPNKSDFKDYDAAYNGLKDNADSPIGIFGYLLDTDNNWKYLQLDWMVEHYENKSNFEICAYIRDVKNKCNYVAPPMMQKILTKQMERMK